LPVAHLTNADFAIVAFGLVTVAFMILIDAGAPPSRKNETNVSAPSPPPAKARGGPIIDLIIIAALAAAAYAYIFVKWYI
jgi:hypothetical protein